MPEQCFRESDRRGAGSRTSTPSLQVEVHRLARLIRGGSRVLAGSGPLSLVNDRPRLSGLSAQVSCTALRPYEYECMSFSLQEPLAITNRSCHAEASTEDRVLQTPALSLAAASVQRFTAGAGGSPLAAPQARHRWRQVVISLQSRPRTAWRLRRRSWPLPPPAALPGSELPSFTGPASPLSTPTPRARPSGPVQATAPFTR